MRRYNHLYSKFLRLVKTKKDCYAWEGKKDYQGYAVLAGVKAARIAYEFYVGEIPFGKCILHTCDNVACTNYRHLWLGSKGDNNADRARKGRNKFPWRTLTIGQVRRIRRLSENLSRAELARRYKVSAASIWQIVTRRSYKYV